MHYSPPSRGLWCLKNREDVTRERPDSYHA
nr:MAG TPA: hypothetical protein [Caudoviricetes sp.]